MWWRVVRSTPSTVRDRTSTDRPRDRQLSRMGTCTSATSRATRRRDRLVAQTPERLSLVVLAALCDIVECGPGDLIVPEVVEAATTRKAIGADLAEIVELRQLGRPRGALIDPDRR